MIGVLRRAILPEPPFRKLPECPLHSFSARVSAAYAPDASRRFARLAAEANSARDADQRDLAVAKYRDALRVWRGPALAGIDSHIIRIAADHLDERRITVNEDRIALELDLGRHHELAAELTELIGRFPLRERLREQLMIALYRCDRTAEALQAYQDARGMMIDELGIEPNERLRRLEHAILTADPDLDLAAGRAVARLVPPPMLSPAPCMLPADIADFTGRHEQIATTQQYLTGDDQARLAVCVAVVSGKGGVGNTVPRLR